MKAIVRYLSGATLVALVAMSCAWAQQPQTTRVRGAIASVDGPTLTVRPGEGADVKLTLSGDAQVFGVVQAGVADIKPGSFVGVGAMPQPDGRQKAIQVLIFAEALRGIGEGHRPWDRPGSTMTNGTVDTTVKEVDGQVLTVKYKDGEKKIVIAPESTIRAYVTGDRSELKPGANISTFANKNPDGTLVTSRITVGRGGIAP